MYKTTQRQCSNRRGKSRVWPLPSPLLRLLLALLALGTAVGQLQAQNSCVIRETVTLGERYNSASHTFTSMSAITAVDVLQRSANWSSCPASKYYFSDNRLNTLAGCRAEFRVTGLEAGCTVPGTGGGDIAQAPLFMGMQAEPNVMFLLDDSGSMHFELMPDALTSRGGTSVYYVFPRATGIYGGDDYGNNVPTVDSNDAFNARARSPQVNTIYYNPAVTYKPWTRHDGSSYPPASLTCALHNPERVGTTAAYCRNLTVDNGRYNNNNWINNNGNASDSNKTFWPATYFWQTGDANLWSGFTRVEIRSTTATYSGHGRDSRTDCADAENGNCTYAEEIQNFANWYTYYRSRILAARGGIGKAFAQQGSGMRVGFGAINKGSTSVDGVSTRAIIDGVRRFTGEDRERFFTSLYTHVVPNAGTPLRRALDAAGQYFMRTDNRGPWGDTPGTDVNKPHLACRRCYTVLMTDGYWSTGSENEAATSAARANTDGSDGSSIRNDLPEGEDYTYRAVSPFTDSRQNTLADVAMYYWKTDLRGGSGTGLSNVLGATARNPAFWQHMTTYGVGLGVVGAVDPQTAFDAIGTGANVSWPNPNDSESAKIDDLLHASVNSRGGFFSAADPDTFASELARVLQEISQEGRSSSASIAANSTRLDTETLIFQASFNGLDWSGELRAFSLNGDGSVNDEIWSTHTAGKIPAHGARNIFTAVGTQGTRSTTGADFVWGSLNSEQQGFLSTGAAAAEAATVGAARLSWLRGDKTNEDGATIKLRSREHLLGDIVNSDPFFVGTWEDFGYRALPGTEGSSYASFVSSKSARRSMVYVGANDGMLHGFDAHTGEEVFGYVPLGVYPNLHELTNPNYQHRYYVDGSPRAGDAYIGGAWRTVLLGSTGAGGKSVFALNVTNPSSFTQESRSSNLMWDFSTSATATHKLGVAMSQPVIARVRAGDRWVAIFGNGYRSGDNVKLFVLDLASGVLLQAIDTGVDGATNGLASVVPVDVNNDRITDYVYGGDLEGNLWKFDFTGSGSSNWSVSRIFKAEDRDGNAQPITSRPAVGKHPDGGLMVYFGTGKYFETGDGAVTADPQIQTFYGIRDQSAEVERDQLVQQEIIFEDYALLSPSNTLSATKVRAVSSNSSNSTPTAGWYLDLVPPPGSTGQGERVVSTPILRYGRIIFTSIIPSEDPCDFGGTSWLMELDAITGGRLTYSALDVNNDGRIDDNDFITVNGERIPVSGQHSKEMIKTPGIVGAGEVEYKYTSGSSGTIGVTREKGAGDVLGRQSWRQLQ